MRVLVVNAGSSSVKLSLLGPADELLADHELGPLDSDAGVRRLAAVIGKLPEVDAVGHRIVHGGQRFTSAVRVDAAVERQLRALSDLAPLHQAKSLAALDAVGGILPDVPAVACFDTAFHTTLPDAAATYALPAPWRARWHVRRYGFHGLSHAYISRRAAELLDPPPARLISAHLGAGASLAAVRDGHSVDTTMGFTPLEGLVMATRSGSVDPGLVLWLLEHARLTTDELGRALEHDSGLRGLAGTADMRKVLARRQAGDKRAVLALDVYMHRLRAEIASMAAALGGVDALAFTGGVGERSPEVRAEACRGLGFLGIALDAAANAAVGEEGDVSPPAERVRVLVIAAREDLEIARQVRTVLGAD
ncbi:MAG TPA: acetate/propionate family kinase [Solirubrobacteraceae bacterium]|nr:acetate/propionate family kinase [Solirubrobacteraceae bacterium]